MSTVPPSAPAPLVVPAGYDRARPRARPRPAPPRRARQADRRGEVRRRPRLPRGVVRGHDPFERRPCPPARVRARRGLRLDEGRVRDRGRHPGRQHRVADQRRPARPGPDRRRDPAPRRAAGARRGPGPTDASGGQGRRHAAHRGAPGGLRPARERPRLRALRDRLGRPRRGLRGGGGRARGDVQRRAPGAALHREQRDDRRARGARRADRSTARCSARTTSTRR